MIKQRYDNKGRLLLTNESQQKNGSYTYRYTDNDSIKKNVSSCRLLPSDPMIPKRKGTESLREMEERINRSLVKGLNPILDEKVTFNDYWEKYLSMKCEIAESTLVGYIYLYNHHIRKVFGKRLITQIRYSEIKSFYIEKLHQGLNISSISNMHNIISPVFQLALREGIIEINPAEGLLSELKRRKDWEVKVRRALTEEQQRVLVEYVANSYEFKNWLPMITIFLGCGLRAGELLGLTWEDIDFERNILSVNHTLNYDTTLDGHCQFFITFPKTKNGARDIPMLDDVRDTLKEMYERRMDFNGTNQVMVDGFTNFIFRDLYGNVYSSQKVNANLRRIRAKYNEEETKRAKEENREPYLLPDFTCHHLRHTFCTRIIESGKISIKTTQYLMGHAYPETTLKIYTSVTEEQNRNEMTSLNGILKIK